MRRLRSGSKHATGVDTAPSDRQTNNNKRRANNSDRTPKPAECPSHRTRSKQDPDNAPLEALPEPRKSPRVCFRKGSARATRGQPKQGPQAAAAAATAAAAPAAAPRTKRQKRGLEPPEDPEPAEGDPLRVAEEQQGAGPADMRGRTGQTEKEAPEEEKAAVKEEDAAAQVPDKVLRETLRAVQVVMLSFLWM